MTKPEIRTATKEGVGGIIQRGKPAGLWMCCSNLFPRIWTGADADGERTEVFYGTFGEVLSWLMVRGGIMPKTGTVANRNASRDPEYRVTRRSTAELRIEGAVIKDWKDPDVLVQGFNGTPVGGEDAKRLTQSRSNGGSQAPDHTREDGEIIELFKRGLTYRQIGEKIGLNEATVYKRIKRAYQRGEDLPAEREQKSRDKIAQRDAELIRLAGEGLNGIEIAKRVGMPCRTVQNRLSRLRARGLLGPKNRGVWK